MESIGLVYTTLLTIENKRIVIPNSSISNSPITNSTGEEKKKLVLNIGIGYSADLKKAKEILRRLFEEHPAILKEDGILVVVDSLGESSVNLSVRGWTPTEEYWTARWELTEAVKLAFDEEGSRSRTITPNVHLTEKQKQSGQARQPGGDSRGGNSYGKKRRQNLPGRYMKGSFGRAVWSRISSIPLRRL